VIGNPLDFIPSDFARFVLKTTSAVGADLLTIISYSVIIGYYLINKTETVTAEAGV